MLSLLSALPRAALLENAQAQARAPALAAHGGDHRVQFHRAEPSAARPDRPVVFLAPLMVALLAGPLLGEWVGWRRLVAISSASSASSSSCGRASVALHPAVRRTPSAMLAYAVFMLLTRYLAAYDPPLVTLFYSIWSAPSRWRRSPSGSGCGRQTLVAVAAACCRSACSAASGTTCSSTPTGWRRPRRVAPFLYLRLLTMDGVRLSPCSATCRTCWTLVGAAVDRRARASICCIASA